MTAAKSRREDTPAGRLYTIEGVGRFPSVTTVLDVIAKPALIEWAASVDRAYVIEQVGDLWESLRPIAAVHDPKTRMSRLAFVSTLKRRMGSRHQWKRERDAALVIGREVHDLIEWHLHHLAGVVRKQPQVAEPAMLAYRGFSEWLTRSGFEPRWVEFAVWSELHGYAGTLDTAGLLNIEGRGRVVALGDWKSSKRIFGEAVLQVSAYVVALREMGHLPDELGPVWAFIVRLPKRPDDKVQVFLISPEVQAAAFEVFKAALTVWRWQVEPIEAPEAQLSADPARPGLRLPISPDDPALFSRIAP